MSEQSFYEKGAIVIYRNGDRLELGVVKRPVRNKDGSWDYFVQYHMGDTAARTPEDLLSPIANTYAFHIIRKSVEPSKELNPAKQFAEKVWDATGEPLTKETFIEIISDMINR